MVTYSTNSMTQGMTQDYVQWVNDDDMSSPICSRTSPEGNLFTVENDDEGNKKLGGGMKKNELTSEGKSLDERRLKSKQESESLINNHDVLPNFTKQTEILKKNDVEREVDGVFSILEIEHELHTKSFPPNELAGDLGNVKYNKIGDDNLMLRQTHLDGCHKTPITLTGGDRTIFKIAGARRRQKKREAEQKRITRQRLLRHSIGHTGKREDTTEKIRKAHEVRFRKKRRQSVTNGVDFTQKIACETVKNSANESSNDKKNHTVNFVRDNDSCFLSLLKDLDDNDTVNTKIEQVSNENEVHASLVMPSISTPSKLQRRTCYSNTKKEQSNKTVMKSKENICPKTIKMISGQGEYINISGNTSMISSREDPTPSIQKVSVNDTSSIIDVRKPENPCSGIYDNDSNKDEVSTVVNANQEYEDLCAEIDFDDNVFQDMDDKVIKKIDDMQVPSSHICLQRADTLPISNISTDRINKFAEDTTIKDGNSSINLQVDWMGQPIAPLVNNTQLNSCVDDDYGDFSAVDFDEMDKLVAQRTESNNLSHYSTGTCMSTTHATDCTNTTKSMTYFNDMNSNDSPAHISFTRYKIVSVVENMETFTKTLGVVLWNLKAEIIDSEMTNCEDGYIYLQGEWFHTKCEIFDTIHVCSISGRYKTDISVLPITLQTGVDDMDNDLVMVVHPNILITPTLISEAVTCSRRAVLKSRMGSNGFTSKAAIVGTMRHELFECCLVEQTFSFDFAQNHALKIVRKNAEALIGCGIHHEGEAINEVIKILPQIQQFALKYTSFINEDQSTTSLDGNQVESNVNFRADTVFAVEESLVSSELGLKGFVDVTVEVITTEKADSHPLRSLMSIELKTGHNQNTQHAHTAQLSLYTLSLRSQHGSAIINTDNGNKTSIPGSNGASNGGMLLYLNHESFRAVHVSPNINEVKSLINHRNLVATELKKASKPRGVDFVDGKEISSEITKLLLSTPVDLPELVFSPHSCQRCYSNRECMLYAAADNSENGFGLHSVKKTHGVLLDHFSGHLNKKDMDYFRKWNHLIDLEEYESKNNITKSWLENSSTREELTGKCMSSLVINDSSFIKLPLHDSTVVKSTLTIELTRSRSSKLTTPLNALKFELENRVVLSSDCTIFHASSNNVRVCEDSTTNSYQRNRKHQMNILQGIVDKIEVNSVFVRIRVNDILQIRNFISLLTERHANKGKDERSEILGDDYTCLFRLDKEESFTGVGTLRQNLVNIFTADIPSYSVPKKIPNLLEDSIISPILKNRIIRLRNLIVHLDRPQFDISAQPLFSAPVNQKRHSFAGGDFTTLAKEFSYLNSDQKAAVMKVLSARQYTIVQGFPGTGKTSTVVFLARLLAARGKRILITSYTHAAVDNLVLKLMDCGVGLESDHCLSDIIRIGRKSVCHTGVQCVLASSLACSLDLHDGITKVSSSCATPSAQSLFKVVSNAKIVGVSALTIPKSPLLVGQHFDVVIVDEAGQISQPAILGALMAADSFILVGDHEQLPPLVKSNSAEHAGFGTSMLKRLAEKIPSAVTQLTFQYRMHEDICNLCNKLVYGGKLKCANDRVRSNILCLQKFPGALLQMRNTTYNGNGGGWMLPVLNPHRPVVFVNIDFVSTSSKHFEGHESVRGKGIRGGSIVNEIEAQITVKLIKGLLSCGLESTKLALICPYRSQINLLNEDPFFIEKKKLGLELSTIDRFQGRDKEVIILSLVRSNIKKKVGRLLEDYRRLNVAFSRAKRKLIIIGSLKTLDGSTILNSLVTHFRVKKWIEELPENALQVYN